MPTGQYDYSRLGSCGEDVFISAAVEIRRPQQVHIGKHVAIDTGFYCTVGASVGDYIHIGPYVTVIGGAEGRLTMGHFTTIAAGSRIICGSDEHLGHGLVGPTAPEPWRDKVVVAPVTLQMFASLATNVVVVAGVTLGEGCVVGACSLVTRDTEPWTIYAGVPARPIKARPKERMRQAARALGYL
jgi:dTDP-4-amino-4,6-dideoxy-D-glucose acyltransferase